ncbi:glycosyltransferase family 10 domain-containing protein [Pedobacter agri]|uniref:glycosyltransferase family 10 domain-containing protein n=1 Tax=Pedobacter agri TaxID=454586 RepID=UPI00292E1DE6|nr:glycosyltransferase family 10 [Pedobacter agri]
MSKNKIVKISTPWGHSFLKDQISPYIDDFKFEIDNDCRVCDFWIVWGDLPGGVDRIKVDCPMENIFFMTDEAHPYKTYHKKFLSQFHAIITCRNDIEHKNIISTHEINTWHIPNTYEELFSHKEIIKSKEISVVCSDLTDLPGHKARFAFVNKLIGHFKDKLDIYGRGFNPIDDKLIALMPYKYSIAIENSAIDGYFTEKISECYLTHTLPIYYGAPDIENYFDSNSLLKIDITDYRKSVQNIEELLESNSWKSKEHLLIEQKFRYLNKYHLFPALSKILRNQKPNTKKKSINLLYSHNKFLRESLISKVVNLMTR